MIHIYIYIYIYIHWLHLCKEVRLPQWESCGPIGWNCCIHRLYLCEGLRHSQWVSCCPGGWSCGIHQLHLCNGVRPHLSNECHGYDIKESHWEAPVMFEVWGMRVITSLLSLLGSLWSGVVAPNNVLSISQMELFDTINLWSTELFEIEQFLHLTKNVLMLNWIVWKRTFWSFNCA